MDLLYRGGKDSAPSNALTFNPTPRTVEVVPIHAAAQMFVIKVHVLLHAQRAGVNVAVLVSIHNKTITIVGRVEQRVLPGFTVILGYAKKEPSWEEICLRPYR